MKDGILKRASLALLLVVLTCLAPRLRHPVPATFPVDFHVYYTASLLVRQGHAEQIYMGADTGVDPQKVVAAPGTPIDRAARRQGLSFVGLYLYPPVLAYLLLPLTVVPLGTATHLWYLVNIAFVMITALLVARLLRLRTFSVQTGFVLLSALCFTPVLQCLTDGQITILLLMLWTAGLVLYREDRVYAAAVVFALATAIKLTPALVLVPFLLWRKWRLVAAYALSLLCLALLCVWVNTPGALLTYFTRVLPAMSGALPYVTNFSFAASTERLVTLLRTGTVAPFPDTLPRSTVLMGKAASTCLALALIGFIARAGRTISKDGQVLVLGLLSLMAPILSPVSWFHAYATAYLAFALLWRECLSRPVRTAYLVALTVVSLLLGSAASENLLTQLVLSGHDVLATCLHFGQLLAAAGIVFYRIWRLRGSPSADGVGADIGLSSVPEPLPLSTPSNPSRLPSLTSL